VSKVASPFICYSVSIQDLLTVWVKSYHFDTHVIAVWDATKHYDLLKKYGFTLKKTETFNNKVLLIQYDDIDDAMELICDISHINGPYVQVYSSGKLITDNIEK